MPADTIALRFLNQSKVRPDAPAYYVRRDDGWRATNWKTHVAETRRMARALIACGLSTASVVCILGWNRPEWVVMDMAAVIVGGAPAGIYTTCSSEEVVYIVGHSEATVLLVENEQQWKKVEPSLAALPKLRHVVMMRGSHEVDHPMVYRWDDFLALGDDVPESDVDARVDALEPSGLATLIYTSGTTGPPKAVMLSHDNLAWTSATARKMVRTSPDDCVLSYLPLSHIAEQMFTVHGPATEGYAVYFAESLERVPDNLKEVQPTVFFGVPRIWEKFHAGVSGKLASAQGAKKRLVAWARDVGAAYNRARCEGRPAGTALKLQYRIADRLVFSKLKPAIGLGRARVCVSGAAPVAKEILDFFGGFDLTIQEVYGQSEGTGPTTFNSEGHVRYGTVGQPIPGADVRIAEDGEILLKGRNVFLGYLKDPEATSEALRDGYLCSGDLGTFDGDGFLTITGRKKEILITSGGKNITPKNIEQAIKNHPLVGEVVLIGDRRPYLTALIALDPEACAEYAKAHSIDGLFHDSNAIREEIERAVEAVNATLARVETVKKFCLLSRPLSLEAGELTPTLKIKRKVVYANFSSEIEAMYASG